MSPLTVGTIGMIVATLGWCPFYVYGLRKWYQFKHHWLIKNRFPKESVIIITFTYLLTILTSIQSVMLDTKLTTLNDTTNHWIFSTIIAVGLFVITSIYYGAHLIYLAAIKNRINLKEETQAKIALSAFKMTADGSSLFKPVSLCKSPQQHWSAKILLAYNIFSSIFVFWGRLYDIQEIHPSLFGAWFGISTLIGLSVIIRVFYHKIKDILGCLVEVYMGVVIMMINSIFPAFSTSVASIMVVAFITLHTLSSFKLWIPLYFIYQTEGSLDIDTFLQKEYHYNAHDGKTEVTEQARPNDNKSKVKRSLDQPLHTFLKDENNYRAFANYSALCFAIENIRFVERIVIFHQIICKYKYSQIPEFEMGTNQSANISIQENQRNTTSSIRDALPKLIHSVCATAKSKSKSYSRVSDHDEIDIESPPSQNVDIEIEEHEEDRYQTRKSNANHSKSAECEKNKKEDVIIYELRFEYLDKLRQEYNEYFQNRNLNDEIGINQSYFKFEDVKQCLWSVSKIIYHQFIDDNATLQLNIPGSVRREIEYLLKDEGNKDKFQSYDDFLNLFHDAMVEAWQLMENIYSFGFKIYITK